jgi:anti-anti-sigma factor
MRVTISTNGAGVLVLAIEGELDVVTVSDLRSEIDKIVGQRPGAIVIDLSSLRMVDSSGVGAIVSLYKRVRAQGGAVSVAGLRDQPLAIFRLLRLDRVMVGDTLAAAPSPRKATAPPARLAEPYLRTTPDIVDDMRRARERGPGTALLIGAGCSASAGIGTAADIVAHIRTRYGRAWRRQPEKTYAALMAELTVGERHELIAEVTDGTVPNATHRGIARLIKSGHVTRVLTTNFDDLLPQACVAAGVRHYAHDVSSVETYDAGLVREPSLFYLHGRDGGFVQHHTDPAMQRHAEQLGPLLADATTRRLIVAIGYSGLSDPVFDRLASMRRFTYGLYWTTYAQALPPPHVVERLLTPGKDAYFVPTNDSDELLDDICSALQV